MQKMQFIRFMMSVCEFLWVNIKEQHYEGAARGEGRIRKEWKRIGRIEKSVIPILFIQLVTICNRLIH